MSVSHQQIYKPGMFGGITNTTLCGRVDNSGDDMNVEDDVTCKMCRRILDNPKDRRNKWVGWTPPADS